MSRLSRPSRGRIAVVLLGLLAAAGVLAVPAASATVDHGPRPTIVLVHGAWADASSWNGVIRRLQDDGYAVVAPPNPLRGVEHDARTIAEFVKTIPGPVVLAGHSYGGMVITNAAAGLSNVKALVYDDAYIPAQGETVFQINQAEPGSCVAAADPTTFLNLVPYPGGPASDVDAYLKVAPNSSYAGFDECFANGVDRRTSALLAAGQRPFAVSAGSEPSGPPAWATIPSWAIVGTQDHVIPPAEQLAMARRAGSHIVTVRAGHLSLVSNASTVAETIEAAVRSRS